MANIFKTLAKRVLVPLGLTAAASAKNVAIQNNFWIRHAFLELTKANNINNFKRRNG